MHVLIVGCGYVGLELGEELAGQGHRVWGIRRTRWPQGKLDSMRITPLVADVTQPDTLASLPIGYDWVVFCVSASSGGVEQYRAIYLSGLRNVLSWLAGAGAPPQKFVYTGSTSVYGQTAGDLVDENSPTEPVAETARVLVQAEKELLSDAGSKGIPAIVLRLAGIYGPGRGFWLKQYLAGQAQIEDGGKRILNMIHRNDAVGAVIAALLRGKPGEIYNVVDDEPVSQLACFKWLSARLGRELPRAVSTTQSAVPKRGNTNKQVSNRRLHAELQCDLKYPTFREGFEEEIRRLGVNS